MKTAPARATLNILRFGQIGPSAHSPSAHSLCAHSLCEHSLYARGRYPLALCALVMCAFGFALVSPTSVAAQSDAKQRPARSVDVKKLFGYYDIYLGLPPAQRDGFRMSYRLSSRQASSLPQMSYALGTVRTPIQISPNGTILTMPDANMLRNGKVEIAAGQPSGSINLNLEAIVPLSRLISVADAANPLVDYAAAVGRAGPLALLAPKLTAITFKGGAGGQAVFPDGRRVGLPIVAGGVRFQPNTPALRGAVSLAFPNVPSEAEFAR